MEKITIKCPKCGEIIELTAAISRDIEEAIKRKYDIKFEELKRNAEKKLEQKDQEIEERLKRQGKLLEEKIKKEVEELKSLEFNELKEQLQEKSKKLIEAEKNELDLRRRQREIEEKHRALELEMARKLDAERKKIIDGTTRDIEEKHRLKDAEKDKQLEDMRKQIEELKRKAEQGSQQTQGEVLEVELEKLLKREFPFDTIEPIAKGIKGADVLEIVKTQSGRECGKILWETKRTKSWSDAWVRKLRNDKRETKADIAVLVSEALPSGFHHFRQVSGVWVTDISSALSLGLALRVVLIQVARVREAQIGKAGKMELVYNYFTGSEFKNRIEAIVEAFCGMKQDLDSEKRLMQKVWAKREKQIERIVSNMVGMRGDLEGIAGAALPAIKILELPSMESKDE
ncbi:hypothetical protein ES707_00605 [subsurface metagenome]